MAISSSIALLLSLSAVSSTASDSYYYCYVCRGRNPVARTRCPVELPRCDLICSASDLSSSSSSFAGDLRRGDGGCGAECYIMQLYHDGSYTIRYVDCSVVPYCRLLCKESLPAPCSARSSEMPIEPRGGLDLPGGASPTSAPFPLYYTCYLYRLIDDDVRVLVDLTRCEDDESPYCALICPGADPSPPRPPPPPPDSPIIPSGAGADDMVCYIVQMYDISRYDSFFVDCSLIGRCSLGCSSQPPPFPPPLPPREGEEGSDLRGSRVSRGDRLFVECTPPDDPGARVSTAAAEGEIYDATELLVDEM
ncbi:uncharacterized protein LOC109721085 [Ananas comosus]|uniref:Uncharacterized protein LOC109721085 n=1 Tax=Ananas comosus TaxID=4615 RepID=A0A6P5G8E1_ANACO|nr:uncharacterized protein LOC109721085 [Ananas comosus]